jgi:hypothetical protein
MGQMNVSQQKQRFLVRRLSTSYCDSTKAERGVSSKQERHTHKSTEKSQTRGCHSGISEQIDTRSS